MVETMSAGTEEMLRLMSTEVKLWRRPALGGARSMMEPNSRRLDQLVVSSGLEQMWVKTEESSAAMCGLAERGMCLTIGPLYKG